MQLLSRRAALASAFASVWALAACQKKAEPPKPMAGGGAAAAYMTANGKKPGVVTTRSGLQYQIVHSGPPDGLRPKPIDEVKVNYEGKLPSGEVFDSSFQAGTPAVFTVNQVVPGFGEALQLMRPGDEWTVWVPPKLGYGEGGKGPIPPDTVMIFRLQLIDVLPAAGSVGRA
jgi:peptidylprolyl isomerase/FKBP-type peptidyl-prolyl cis-trans isomerase FklB